MPPLTSSSVRIVARRRNSICRPPATEGVLSLTLASPAATLSLSPTLAGAAPLSLRPRHILPTSTAPAGAICHSLILKSCPSSSWHDLPPVCSGIAARDRHRPIVVVCAARISCQPTVDLVVKISPREQRTMSRSLTQHQAMAVPQNRHMHKNMGKSDNR
ncbi:MAG: hypothetical protein ACK5PS_17370 [Desulfopila sp.]